MRYPLDLSHLNILAAFTGQRCEGLVAELLASDQCPEEHLGDNDGQHDQHAVCIEPAWRWPLLQGTHPGAVIFSEAVPRKRPAPARP